MLKSISTSVLQHLISQNSWANGMLQPLAGKSVQFNISLVSSTLVILENGSLAIAGETNTPDATVTIPLSLLPRLISKDVLVPYELLIAGKMSEAIEGYKKIKRETVNRRREGK